MIIIVPNLSPDQFRTLYRGLSSTTDIKKPLGMHWTDDPERAMGFARNPIRRGPGVVIEGQVARKNRETRPSVLQKNQVYDEYWENEIPVKKGSTVHVLAVTKMNDRRDRTRTYNPPRKWKA
jgi:hypothetical protein